MTRLQRRNSSCNCGKTTKESNSFVTKNKTYETRSGVQRKQEGSNGCQKNLPVNTLNLRGKVFLKKMDVPVINLPIRNGKLNGTTIPSIKSSTTKICKKKCVKNDTNGVTNELIIDDSLKDIISAKLQVGFADIKKNLQKEDTAISDKILATKELLVKSLTTDSDKIKDGMLVNGNFSPENQLKTEKIQSDITETVSNREQQENSNGFHPDDEDDEQNGHVSCEKAQKIKRKKRTAFELFIKDTCENIGMGVLTDKRTRRAPCSYSPDSPRKLNVSLDLNDQTSIKVEVEVDQENDKQTLIKVEDMQPLLTKKGLPFKRKGRKPKPKGPIEHYLDVFVRNKEKSSLPNANAPLVVENDINAEKTVCVEKSNELTEENKILCNLDETYKPKKIYKKIFLPICNATPFRNRYQKYMKKTQQKKQFLKNQKTVDKLNTEEFPSPIIFVLGYRSNRGKKEMLVQFENGTSNWINYSEHEFNVSKMKEFYEHSEQDLSTVNRIGYKSLFPSVSACTTSEDESELSSGDESDSSEVFFRSPPSSLNTSKMDILQLKEVFPIETCTIEDDMLEPDVGKLCSFVMSSNCLKLYPSEQNQEFLVKHDDSFVNIFLRRKSNKDQKKTDCVNQKCCEKLINTLEDCTVDENCGVVVIHGIEEFFASNQVFEKLLKKSYALEGQKYEEDISTLRYLTLTMFIF